MNTKLTRATAFALMALLTLPMGCDEEEIELDPISAVTKGEELEEADPIPPPPPAPKKEEDRTTGKDDSPPDQAPPVPTKAGASEGPATEAPPAGEEAEAEAVVTTTQGQTTDTMGDQNPPANPAATVRIFLSNDQNPDFGYIVAAQLDAWMPGEMPACKAKFESWGDKRRTAYNKRLEGIVRYLVYHISDSFKTRAEVYGGKLDGTDVEAMTEDNLREWLSGEPTRLELYALGRWHLPHSGATVPVRFGGKPKAAVEETRTPEAPTTGAPAPKADVDDAPPHAPEPATPAPDSGAPPSGDSPAPPAPTPGNESPPAPPSGDTPAPEPATPAPDSGAPPPGPASI